MKAQYKYLEWDKHNLWKNEIKHGVTAEEIEQSFNNPPFVIFPHKRLKNRKVLFGQTFSGRYLLIVFQHKSNEVARPIHARNMNKRRNPSMKNRSETYKTQEEDTLEDFDLTHPEVITESLNVSSRYEGKLKLIKTSVSLPRAIIEDLRHLARIKGMSSYQNLLREFVSERVFEEKKRLKIE